eukprot:8766143-Pyramimonas_sp.AAC.1
MATCSTILRKRTSSTLIQLTTTTHVVSTLTKTVMTEQHRLFNNSYVAAKGVYISDASEKVVVLKKKDFCTKAEIQTNPAKISKVLCTESKAGLTAVDSKCKRSGTLRKHDNK